jgi:sialate O-acetylesterase
MTAIARIPLRVLTLALVALTCLLAARAQQAAVAEPEQAQSTIALASVFSDHMVLQRDMEIPVWGEADPGAEVRVTFDDEVTHATADDEGRWQANLESREAGGPHELTVTVGDDEVKLTDVLVGDVWVASGQSNMEWPVAASDNAETEAATADWPEIRFIDVPNQTGDKPRNSFETPGWQAVTPQNIGRFSAVAYFFGRDLHKELKVPVGLIGCNWGGTPMEAWTSREALESSPTFAPLVKAADAPPADDKAAEDRRRGPQNQPSALFNGMTSAVIPYAIRGVIWYQGESNAGRANQYAELSKLMIADWRNRWGQGDFPFLLVQLSAWEPGGDGWPLLREAQVDTLETPNTGMAVAIDIGHRTDIHPKNKQEVGRRLALAARAVAYGQDLVYSGPMFRELTIENGKARLSFDHLGGGLTTVGELKGFEIAGADGKFVPATATIDAANVIVASDRVPEPTQVRYNWAAFPDGNLYNAEGLPAVPFRSKR